MRIKLDENMPTDLVAELQAFGHDVEDVYAEGLSGRPDSEIWTAAQAEGADRLFRAKRFGLRRR